MAAYQDNNIYLRYSIEKNLTHQASDEDILRYLQKHLESVNSIQGKLTRQDGKWILMFNFSDTESFDCLFTRNLSFYELFARLKLEGFFDVEEIRNSNRSANDSDNAIHDWGSKLILKQATNRKRPIKENYQLSFQMADMIDYGAFYEEIEDGFLIFYHSLADFYDMQVDRLDYETMESWLRSKGLWNDSTRKLLDRLLAAK